MLPLPHLPKELFASVHRRIDLASQCDLGAAELVHHLAERDAPDHHQVDVALVTNLAPCRGPVDERDVDPIGQRHQRPAHDVGNTRGLDEQRLKLGEDG